MRGETESGDVFVLIIVAARVIDRVVLTKAKALVFTCS